MSGPKFSTMRAAINEDANDHVDCAGLGKNDQASLSQLAPLGSPAATRNLLLHPYRKRAG